MRKIKITPRYIKGRVEYEASTSKLMRYSTLWKKIMQMRVSATLNAFGYLKTPKGEAFVEGSVPYEACGVKYPVLLYVKDRDIGEFDITTLSSLFPQVKITTRGKTEEEAKRLLERVMKKYFH